jgi:mRNA interferase RelE/StbE
MHYSIEIARRARKDLKKLDAKTADRILVKIAEMESDLSGDVKRLTDFEPEYRLRVGDFRVLFDVERDQIIVRRVKNRREAY